MRASGANGDSRAERRQQAAKFRALVAETDEETAAALILLAEEYEKLAESGKPEPPMPTPQ